jgi:hypothetical protein
MYKAILSQLDRLNHLNIEIHHQFRNTICTVCLTSNLPSEIPFQTMSELQTFNFLLAMQQLISAGPRFGFQVVPDQVMLTPSGDYLISREVTVETLNQVEYGVQDLSQLSSKIIIAFSTRSYQRLARVLLSLRPARCCVIL